MSRNSADRLCEMIRGLSGSKTVTERRRMVEIIDDLLNKEDVLMSLDRRDGWKELFKVCYKIKKNLLSLIWKLILVDGQLCEK